MIARTRICRHTRQLFSRSPPRSSTIMNSSRPPRILTAGIPVEGERVPGYRQEFYYLANPGEVLHRRYKVLTKIGWGTASTVWLAEDLER